MRPLAGAIGRRALQAAAAAFLILAAPCAAHAGEPTDRIRGAIDRATAILNDAELKGSGDAALRRDLLRREIEPVFDFAEMSRRCLGPDWRNRTDEERREFVRLFRGLLEAAYLGRIEAYKGKGVRYVGEAVDPPYALVETRVLTRRGHELPVSYRMIRGGEGWRIYDVVVEGISLVNNYRAQFRSVLQKSSFEEMMEKLRATLRGQSS